MNVLKPHRQTTFWTLLEGGPFSAKSNPSPASRATPAARICSALPPTLQTSQGVATDSSIQNTAPRAPTDLPISPPVAIAKCEPQRNVLAGKLRRGRNATVIYLDLMDLQDFDGTYNSVKRCVAQLRNQGPEQFDLLSVSPGGDIQVDYGEGAPTRVTGNERWCKPRLFVAWLRGARHSSRRVVWNSGQQI